MKSNYKKILQASILIAISAILYGFLGFFGTGLLQDNMSIPTMLFWRFFIAGCWILLFVIKKYPTQTLTNQINKRTLIFMLILGSLSYAGTSGFYFIASQYTGTGLAMVIFFSYPIIVALASWFMKQQHFNVVTLFILMTMTMGLFLLHDSSTQQVNAIGILFGIASAICYASYVMGSKYISSVITDTNVLTIMVCLGCSVIFLLLSISLHHFVFPGSLKSWFYLLALGILATAVPIQLMLEGLKYVSSMRASIISVLEPLVTVGVGVVMLDEFVSNMQMLGIVIILGSTLLVQFQRKL